MKKSINSESIQQESEEGIISIWPISQSDSEKVFESDSFKNQGQEYKLTYPSKKIVNEGQGQIQHLFPDCKNQFIDDVDSENDYPSIEMLPKKSQKKKIIKKKTSKKGKKSKRKSNVPKKNTETKNTSKNYIKAILNFAIKKENFLAKKIRNYREVASYLNEWQEQRQRNNREKWGLRTFHSLWLNNPFASEIRMISQHFLRKQTFKWLFNSKRLNHCISQLKYRQTLRKGLINPEQFIRLKQS